MRWYEIDEGWNKLPDNLLPEIVSKIESGRSATEVSDDYNVDPGSMRKFLVRHDRSDLIRKSEDYSKLLPDIIAKIKAGQPASKVSIDYGFASSTLPRILKRYGYSNLLGTTGRKIDDSLLPEIIAKIESGRSAQNVADDYSVAGGTLQKFLRNHGREDLIRIQNSINDTQLPEIITKIESGRSATDVARDYDINFETMIRFLRRHGREDLINQQNPINDNLLPEIVAKIETGRSPSSVSMDYGSNHHPMIRFLKKHGRSDLLTTRHEGITYTPDEINLIQNQFTKNFIGPTGILKLLQKNNPNKFNHVHSMGIKNKLVQILGWERYIEIMNQIRPRRTQKQFSKKIIKPGTIDNLKSKGPGSKHSWGLSSRQYQ